MKVAASLRAMPTMLRVGLAETIAYRAEMIVWILTTTMPLVMLALWTSVASEAPFQQFTRADFVAYYLGALIVRNLTSNWVAWQLAEEIRTGTLSMRLLRPVHPYISYATQHIAAIPLRALIALPVATIMLIATSGSRIATDPVVIALIPVTIAGAWLITFSAMTVLGSLAMVIKRSIAVWEIWMGLFAVLSGYLVPLELMPRWLSIPADYLPFRYMLGFPVQVMIGMVDRTAALEGVGVQAVMIAVLFSLSGLAWRLGLRRFEAYGA